MTDVKFAAMCYELEEEIKGAYETGVTLPQAEKLAAQFLHAQIQVSEKLRISDLNASMRRTGVKTVRASKYLATCEQAEKKPTEGQLEALLNNDDMVRNEQEKSHEADAQRAALQRSYDIFFNAHVYFRGVAKGRFE